MNHSFKEGMKDGIPVALGYFAVSFTFGMAASTSGIRVFHAVLISLLNVTSAGQFSALTIIGAGGSYIEIALATLIINLRYCLMSFSLAQKMDSSTKNYHRFTMAYSVTDEIFALDSTKEERLKPSYHYGITCVAVPGWVLGTFIGALLGNLLPAFIISALGVAIYSMFLAIIIPPSKKDKAILLVVLIAMLLSTLFQVIPILEKVSSGFVIIIVTLVVSGIAAILHPIEPKEEPK